jgi:hypothetical protein
MSSIISVRSTHLGEKGKIQARYGSAPLTNRSGSGSGRPKSMRILRIRIPNTARIQKRKKTFLLVIRTLLKHVLLWNNKQKMSNLKCPRVTQCHDDALLQTLSPGLRARSSYQKIYEEKKMCKPAEHNTFYSYP